ncbi:MAG: exodeoxyribonuclease VII large subunit [Methylacidiphilales bacterium]|nr:exodeoxyribonuclease VII large subunit [Candidatus Methylacidiphilales bacterium]
MSPELEILSVSQLNAEIRSLLEGQIGEVSVRGEISNLRRQSSGHVYFTLKDEGGQIRAVLFRGDAARLKFAPADGQGVIVHGELTVYEPRGEYQIRVSRMEAQGKGTLQERFEALKRKLQAEGLFEQARKRPIPQFPETVAVVTSPTGAALRDFLNIIRRRCPRLKVQVFGVQVQGEGAAEQVAQALAELNRLGEADLIVVARGGGSLEDLWAFNEEIVARAVAASMIPVISGVGHEIDFTICDFAADLRAPTPSAAAELASAADEDWRNRLVVLFDGLRQNAAGLLQDRRWKLAACRDHYVFREPIRIVRQMSQRLDELENGLVRNLQVARNTTRERLSFINQRWQSAHPQRRLAEWRNLLQARKVQLRLLSPQQTLNRGYSIVFDRKGRILKEVEQALAAGDVKIRFSDGDMDAKVMKKSDNS